MIRLLLAAFILTAASPAFAQQQPVDVAFLQRALDSVAAQRNNAQNAAAIAEAKAATAEDQLAKALAQIKALEAAKSAAPRE